MRESEEKIESINRQKEKIRERYRGIDQSELDVIPAIPQKSIYEDTREKRVGAYVRVSTDDPRQTSSYELQKNHYYDMVSHHAGWKLVEIYADEGISGTSLQHRNAFIHMIDDCQNGKLDLIVTKSVSRFARNVVDCIKYVRELKKLSPPVGVFFEAENIYTLDPHSEMSLSFISTLAQEESHNKSEIMNASIEMRFKRGIFLTPTLLGFDHDEDGFLIINEGEAKTPRLGFFMYLYGYSTQQIADTFRALGLRTKKGNTEWTAGMVLQMLQNERYCGDVLARKTWTPSYLDHKSRKNRFDRNQYLKKNHHEAIISRDDFIAVQRMISNAKYGNKGFLPELAVIPSGILRGFISVNPRWAGFTAQDYRLASASILDAEEILEEPVDSKLVEAEDGEFDLRGFEVARAEFFCTQDKPAVTFGKDYIRFSSVCLRKLKSQHYVEMLVHPGRLSFAVRACTKDTRNAVRWSRMQNGQAVPVAVVGSAYIGTLFELFGWKREMRYRVVGQFCKKDGEEILLFDLHDMEVNIPVVGRDDNKDGQENMANNGEKKELACLEGKNLTGYPVEWADNFGDGYYSMQVRKDAKLSGCDEWEIAAEGVPFKDPELNVTRPEEVSRMIEEIIDELKQESSNERGYKNGCVSKTEEAAGYGDNKG